MIGKIGDAENRLNLPQTLLRVFSQRRDENVPIFNRIRYNKSLKIASDELL